MCAPIQAGHPITREPRLREGTAHRTLRRCGRTRPHARAILARDSACMHLPQPLLVSRQVPIWGGAEKEPRVAGAVVTVALGFVTSERPSEGMADLREPQQMERVGHVGGGACDKRASIIVCDRDCDDCAGGAGGGVLMSRPLRRRAAPNCIGTSLDMHSQLRARSVSEAR